MKHVDVPRWMFEKGIGQRFLAAIQPDGRVSIDGGHSDPQDVAKARVLFESLIVIRPPAGTHYVMVTVEEVPDFVGEVNNEMIAVNNRAALGLPLSATPTDPPALTGDEET